MSRLKVTLAYDGTAFAGYQIQPQVRTVQGELERALSTIHKGESIRTFASGRTDAGVHARGQVVHFDTPLALTELNWLKALQALLPEDIAVKQVERVSEHFHARYGALKKEYRYRLLTTPEPDLFRRLYTLHVSDTLDIDAMQRALNTIIGTHDFTSFSSAKTTVEDKVRTLYAAEIVKERDELIFSFIGDGFLYHMVRILVGTVIEIGRQERQPSDMETILAARSRAFAGKTAPPHGLILWSVTYPS